MPDLVLVLMSRDATTLDLANTRSLRILTMFARKTLFGALTVIALAVGGVTTCDVASAGSVYDNYAVSSNYNAYVDSYYEVYYGNTSMNSAKTQTYNGYVYAYYGRAYNYRPCWNVALSSMSNAYSVGYYRAWYSSTKNDLYYGYVYTYYAYYTFQ